MRTLEQIREIFRADCFATDGAGIKIEKAEPRYALCIMELKPIHLNARGAVMGGAIFTLADFAVAVASNGHAETTNTVSLHGEITFLTPAKGKRLMAEANCIKEGRTTCFYEVAVTDELGTNVARATFNGFTIGK